MKNVALVIFSLFLACNSSQKAVNEVVQDTTTPKNPVVYAQTITEDELREYLYSYASDEFEGRETGEPGQKKAVEYLRNQYQELGIAAAQGTNDYFQKVPLEISALPSGHVVLNSTTYEIGQHILTFSAAQGNFQEVVYVGYGIEDKNYSDYADVDVHGKVVLMKSGEPKNTDGTYKVTGSDEASVWSNMSESLGKRMDVALKKGARGILYYDLKNYKRFQSRFKYMKNNGQGRMGLKSDTDNEFASFLIDSTFAKELFPDIENASQSKTLTTNLELHVQSENEHIDTENVVAVVKGSEKPNEYVIISSHLDHIGVAPDGDINNGADDDGSGTVAMLEIAEAFKKAVDAGEGPMRSVVFLHVTGEEKGLLGSQYYTDIAPIFPLDQTVANLNIDMIGRIDPKRDGDRNYVYLIGSDKLSSDLHQLSEAINKKYTNLELDYTYNDENDPNRFYYRSDHYNFAKNNIPIIFYFNGTHADYHRPSDTPDKINYDLLQNRTRLIFHTAWEVANREQKVLVDKVSR